MDTKETLQAIDDQIENLKLHADIVVSTKLSGFKQIPEHDFEVLKGKVNSKVYNLVVWNATGGMYKAFDFVAPKTQKQMKNVIQWSPYIAAIIATIKKVTDQRIIIVSFKMIKFVLW